jgi:hypothetical protein
MSQKQIVQITRAAIKAWSDSDTELCYRDWLCIQKIQFGLFWGAAEGIT